ncbi:antitoxin Xre-like helix-turn-helix domain-containing protein [Haloferula chungangensis]|uniref:Antitoxin Xre-like helix-turn-helix domain-containing protein n=1 Tax=Haloferula chungangensis TaxID=1048331 RepID=A0ABW2L4T5_9BACT
MKYNEPVNYVSYLRESCREVPGGIREDSVVEDHPSAVIRRIRKGLPMAEFEALAAWLKVTDEELAPLLGISRATFHRRRKAGHLESPESEKLIRFARLLRRATEVLEEEDAAREWLKTPAVAFAGESPLSFADTEIGAREVEYLLGRLEHGVFS